MMTRVIAAISAAAVPDRRRSLYFAIKDLQRHHIDVAQRVWNFATSFTLFEWLNRGDRRWVILVFHFFPPQNVSVTKAWASYMHSFAPHLMRCMPT